MYEAMYFRLRGTFNQSSLNQVMFWVYGGGFIMGDASEENYLPGPLLDTREVWTFVEINQNIQIIALFTYSYPFPSAC